MGQLSILILLVTAIGVFSVYLFQEFGFHLLSLLVKFFFFGKLLVFVVAVVLLYDFVPLFFAHTDRLSLVHSLELIRNLRLNQ